MEIKSIPMTSNEGWVSYLVSCWKYPGGKIEKNPWLNLYESKHVRSKEATRCKNPSKYHVQEHQNNNQSLRLGLNTFDNNKIKVSNLVKYGGERDPTKHINKVVTLYGDPWDPNLNNKKKTYNKTKGKTSLRPQGRWR